ncbi:hypothetical protein BZA70DRAFT_275084 [Myxozyma melibiosi]|uniref:RING-type domain-containing protein n=1 Tax=Myxozyma melibiosi TaxID=54550 RepID=A0ABR1FAC5_9ASCO
MSDGGRFVDSESALTEQLLLSTPTRGRRNQVSISHLLNFSLPPRDSPRRPPPTSTPSWQHRNNSAADKARFVNANFRFVVHPSGDYRAQALDPDVVVPWHLILQVLVSKHRQHANCPICLSENPVAPRMMRCGHIFCLPCLMRMLASDMSADDSQSQSQSQTYQHTPAPRKRNICPICLDSVSLSDARPVKWIEHPGAGDASSVPVAGRDVVLRLVMRKPGSILALPRDGGERPANTSEIPWYFAAEVMHYARLMKGTEEYIADEFAREVRELEVQEQQDEAEFRSASNSNTAEEEDDAEWNHRAIERIFDTMEVMQGMGNAPRQQQQQQGESTGGGGSRSSRRRHKKDRDESAAGSSRGGSSNSRSRSTSMSAGGGSGGATDAPYYFYQPRDASNCFLSALDIRILKTAFGSFALFPSTVLVRVERIVTDQVVDEELKKRTKYLAHLPTGCQYSILECDWTDVVKPEILLQFKEDLDKRRKQRLDKDAREERARVKALKEEEEMKYRTHGPSAVRSARVNNSYSSSSTSLLSASLAAEAENDPELSEALRRSVIEASLMGYDGGAEARESSSLPSSDSAAWPALGTSTGSESAPYSMSASPRAATAAEGGGKTTVWGTPAVAFSRVGKEMGVEKEEWEEEEWDGWAEVLAERERERGRESEAGMVSNMDGVKDEEGWGEAAASSSSKKKKQKKKLVLMSTGGQWRQ